MLGRLSRLMSAWERCRQWLSDIGHAATGFVSSAGTIIAIEELEVSIVAPLIWLSVLVSWRQYVVRRNAEINLGDHIIGFSAGIAVGLMWVLAT